MRVEVRGVEHISGEAGGVRSGLYDANEYTYVRTQIIATCNSDVRTSLNSHAPPNLHTPPSSHTPPNSHTPPRPKLTHSPSA